ncbi:hypothetical protein BJY01DRAFT_247156 [Aspergillus pseudoustus]|uniref:NADH:ubiquinone oxidoreductase intermediate-associated protein 30 domain-containing protein n=1 Tax=Aspergillus pseudoustus TaxID=1810923 RepID=A0ABR4K609_9EURO
MDCDAHVTQRKVLFDGVGPWVGNWKATNSRVVDGISYASLDHYDYMQQTEFHGWLDRQRIDCAAWAAIHTMGHYNVWGIEDYDAIEIVLGKSDGKIYSIVVEDDRPYGFETTFSAQNAKGLATPTRRFIRFDRLQPQSKDGKPVEPLKLDDIRGFGVWIKNTDETQEGAFSLNIHSISVVKLPCSCPSSPGPYNALEKQDGMKDKVKVAIDTVRDQMKMSNTQAQEKLKDALDGMKDSMKGSLAQAVVRMAKK